MQGPVLWRLLKIHLLTKTVRWYSKLSLKKGYFVKYSANFSTLSTLIVTDCKHFDPPPLFLGVFFQQPRLVPALKKCSTYF